MFLGKKIRKEITKKKKIIIKIKKIPERQVMQISQ
jgi:hypothetical protein